MRLLDLPTWLRAYGLDVEEVPGWQRRGADLPGLPSVVIGHHTATSNRAKGDLPTLATLRDGRDDLPGPLCQVALGRSGKVYVIASGKANHAGRGAWAGVTDSWRTVGIEAEHPGTGPWSSAQRDAFDRCAAALLDGLGQGCDRYAGHREWALPAGRKVDPGGIDLPSQRERIRRLLADGPTTRPPTTQEFIVATKQEVAALLDERVRLIIGKDDEHGGDDNPTHISQRDIFRLLQKVDRDVEALARRMDAVEAQQGGQV